MKKVVIKAFPNVLNTKKMYNIIPDGQRRCLFSAVPCLVVKLVHNSTKVTRSI